MPEPTDDATQRARWRRCMTLTAWLMLVGAVVTFGVAWFARALDARLFGWPFSFWVAAQGAPVLYLVLVVIYTRRMRLLDARYGRTGDDDSAGPR